MKNIKLNDKVDLNLEKLIAGKMLLQAGSGGGKSYAIRRILEQSYSAIPQIILDTEGEFSSLREKYDYILIGKGQDIGASPQTAALLALRLWEERVSAIIDLYELAPWERQTFVKNFVDAMVNAPKKLWKPVLLIIDEAHEYAPESDKSDSGRALHLLASKGRKRHIGAIFATQRISSLSKNIVASCKNKLIGYASETNDVKRASFELGFTPAEARGLRDLDPGEFYAFGPALTKEVTKIKIGPVKTSHETSDGGRVGQINRPSLKVRNALAKLADLPQAAAEEAKTAAELKQQNLQLKRQIVDLERKPTKEVPVAMGVSQWFEYGKKLGYVDYFEKKLFSDTKKFKEILYRKLLKSHGNIVSALQSLAEDLKTLEPSPTDDMAPIPFSPKMPENELIRRDVSTRGQVPKNADYLPSSEITPMGAGERQVLIALASYPDGMTREHITVQTGYKRSTRDAYIQRLMQKGYVIPGNAGRIETSPQGFEALGSDYERLPTGRELLEYHHRKLPEGEARILMLLSGREGATRDYITEATGYKRSTRDAYIQRLATRQLVVVERDMIRISDHLV